MYLPPSPPPRARQTVPSVWVYNLRRRDWHVRRLLRSTRPLRCISAFSDANADADATATDGDTNGNLSSSTNSNPTNIFQHVTSLAYNTDDGVSVLAVLAYACIRLGHLSHDAFGDSRAAKRLYKLAASIDPLPSGVAYHGIGTNVEASITHCFGAAVDQAEGIVWREEVEKAVEAYREASRLGGGLGSSGEVLFHLAVALERLEEVEESERIMESLRRGESNLSCLVDSWGYVGWHTRRTNPHHLNLHRGTRSNLTFDTYHTYETDHLSSFVKDEMTHQNVFHTFVLDKTQQNFID